MRWPFFIHSPAASRSLSDPGGWQYGLCMLRLLILFVLLSLGCGDDDTPADTSRDVTDSDVFDSAADTSDTSDTDTTDAPDTTPEDTGSADASTDAADDASDGGSDAPVDVPPGECDGTNLGSMLGESLAAGELGEISHVATTCAGEVVDGPDQVFAWTAPDDGTYVFDTNGSDVDTGIELLETDCETVIACNDDDGAGASSLIRHEVTAGEVVVIVVFGYRGATDDYVLSVTEDGGATETDCGDMLDNDRDGNADCLDSDCDDEPSCTETMCDDEIDNDGDGDTDCLDIDCRDEPSCREDCDDMVDNDGDGRIDCEDLDCSGDPTCIETRCDDGEDDDGDSLIDCEDPDCGRDDACIETNCADGVDDDDDGDIDCADPDCEGDEACTETDCADGEDDDADGDIDCADRDCRGDSACGEDSCTNRRDDDDDGFTDCMDSECACAAACRMDTCPDENLGRRTGMAVASGMISSAAGCTDGLRTGSCAGNGPERTFRFRATAAGTYTFNTEGSEDLGADTVLYVLEGATCGGEELRCNDDTSGLDSSVRVRLDANEEVVIVVDTFRNPGRFVLNITPP